MWLTAAWKTHECHSVLLTSVGKGRIFGAEGDTAPVPDNVTLCACQVQVYYKITLKCKVRKNGAQPF